MNKFLNILNILRAFESVANDKCILIKLSLFIQRFNDVYVKSRGGLEMNSLFKYLFHDK